MQQRGKHARALELSDDKLCEAGRVDNGVGGGVQFAHDKVEVGGDGLGFVLGVPFRRPLALAGGFASSFVGGPICGTDVRRRDIRPCRW